jgi:hypothetical protein
MWLWLVNIAGWLSGNPFIKQLIETLVADLKDEGARILPIAVDAIKTAAGNNQMSGKEKMASVINTVVAQAPNVEKSVINATVNLAYRTLQKDPNVPEVQ